MSGTASEQDGERPEEAVGPEEHELDDPAPRRDQEREEERPARESGVVLRVRDHEEGEEEERAALEPVERDRQRIAQPERPPEHDGAR